jgi:hypothetical protein
LEKDEEVWLEVSSPNVFFFFFGKRDSGTCMSVRMCAYVCVKWNGLSRDFLLLSQSFYNLNLFLLLFEFWTSIWVITLSK